MNTPYTFVFFGIVGSGKGTQVDLLEKYLVHHKLCHDVVFASPGTGYRKLVSEGYYTGELVKTTLEQGHLQPDFLTIGLVTSHLAFHMKEHSALVADGFPRTIAQSEAFEKIAEYYSRERVHIIYIELSKEQAITRMKLRARADDTDEGITNRFDEYVNNVVPSMNYFKEKPGYVIHTINGEQSIEAVHTDIIKALHI